MERISPYRLGATLYMPATRPDLVEIACGQRLAGLRSIVICLEDAVHHLELPEAQSNLRRALHQLGAERRQRGPLLFVRPRNPAMATTLLDWPEAERIDGFVLPKLDGNNLMAWSSHLNGCKQLLMPTLETPAIFDPVAVTELRDALICELADQIIALRIGGNDLLGLLGVRRNRERTLYDGPLAYTVAMLCSILGSSGFALTAPVMERYDRPDLLREELARDLDHGLVGKTAIHPSQIATIHAALQVDTDEYNEAMAITSSDAPAVFGLNGAMCEPATHSRWAEAILARAHHFGVRRDHARSLHEVTA
jgi:citrate lyase beta subunit